MPLERKAPHEMSDTYDLIVIGAGMAGVVAAEKCASRGWRVAIVDALPYLPCHSMTPASTLS